MAGDSRDVNLNIIGRNKARKATDDAAKDFDRLAKRLTSLNQGSLAAAKSLGKAVSTLSAVGAVLIPTTTHAIALGKAMAFGAHAAATYTAALAPVLTALPAVAGGFALLLGTAKMAGPGIAKAMLPITEAFAGKPGKVDGKNTLIGGLRQQIQEVASKGLPALAQGFLKVNFPAVSSSMLRIAGAMNRVMVSVGQWINSANGQALIRNITQGTAKAAEKLAPHAAALAVSFGNMALRGSSGAFERIGSGLSKAADATKRFMDSVSSKDIANAWRTFDNTGAAIGRIPGKLHALHGELQAGVAFWDNNQGAIEGVHLALVGVAIALGALTENWIPALIAGGSLLGANWGAISGIFSSVADWFSRTSQESSVMGGILRELASTGRAWGHTFMSMIDQLKPVVGPFLHASAELGKRLAEMLRLSMPVIELFGLIVLGTMAAVIAILLVAATGLIKFTSGIIGAFNVVARVIARVIGGIMDVIGSMLTGLGDALSHIPGPFRKMGEDLKTAGAQAHHAANDIQNWIDGVHGKTIDINIVTNYRKTGSEIPSASTKIGYKAAGGTATRGRPYIVGEHAPELFVPNTSGRILNGRQTKSAMSGGRGDGLTVIVQAPVIRTDRALRDLFMSALAEAAANGVKVPDIALGAG